MLLQNNYEVIILGGPQEHDMNTEIARRSHAQYLGHFDLPGFISLMDHCNLVVTQVTMAMHIALGLNKKLVLLNNIFNKNEFYLYKQGIIIEPDLNCLGCFKQHFDNQCPVENCMKLIEPENIFQSLLSLDKNISVEPYAENVFGGLR